MRYYELMMVMVPEREEEGFSVALDRVNHYISERGGSVLRQERWGRLRRLAYPIKNFNEGNYVLTHMEMEPGNAKDLEARLMLSEDVLRHLLVKVDKIPEQKIELPTEAVKVSENDVSESPEDGAVSSLEPTDGVLAEKTEASTDVQKDVLEDKAEAAPDSQTTPGAEVEKISELSTSSETEISSETQVIAGENKSALPTEGQVSPIDGENGTLVEDQSIEPKPEQEISSSGEQPIENKEGVG